MKRLTLFLLFFIFVLTGCTSVNKPVDTEPFDTEPQEIVHIDINSEENINYIVEHFEIDKDFLIVERNIDLTVTGPKNISYVLSNFTTYKELPDLMAISSDDMIIQPNEKPDFVEPDGFGNVFSYVLKNKSDLPCSIFDCNLLSMRYNGGDDWSFCGIKSTMTTTEIKNILGEPSFYAESDNGNISMGYYFPLEYNYFAILYEKVNDFPYISIIFGE